MSFTGLKFKLLLMAIFPALTILGLLANSYYVAHELKEKLESSNRVRVPLAIYSGQMQKNVHARMRFFWTALTQQGRDRAESLQRAETFAKNFRTNLAEYQKLPQPDWGVELIKTAATEFDRADGYFQSMLKAAALGTKEGDETAKVIAIDTLRPINRTIEASLEEIDQRRLKAAESDVVSLEATTSRHLSMMLFTGLAVIAAIVAFGGYFASRLANSFTTVARGISGSVEQFKSASSQLSGASQSLSSGASQAAASLEETVASLEELSSMVKQNAENSKEAGSLSQNARSSAEQGEAEVRQLVEAMTQISGSSKKIEEITAVIDDLAFQTNLLALNAAVEAARAGEQGKGFAVVAEAVRNLAQKSGEAAKNINVLIKESVERVERGSAIADRSGNVLREIVTSVKKVADLNQEIASASQEQSTGIAQISKAMNHLDQATQSNASSAEETAAASEELSAEAQSLTTYVELLVKEVEGSAASNFETSAPVASSRNGARPKAPAVNKVLKFSPPQKTPKKPTTAHAPAAPVRSAKKAAEDVIPFGDEAESKVGNVQGF